MSYFVHFKAGPALVSECVCLDACFAPARLSQSAERKALNLAVVGSSPTVGAFPSVASAFPGGRI